MGASPDQGYNRQHARKAGKHWHDGGEKVVEEIEISQFADENVLGLTIKLAPEPGLALSASPSRNGRGSKPRSRKAMYSNGGEREYHIGQYHRKQAAD
ncbi:MAG TPA: hypothetical protein VKB96_14995 [Gammaproteobacteria bacterium]|nr:hypothetical protein [Gammaproteobacteria bacterium]